MTGNFGKVSKHHQYELMSCQYRSTDYWAGDTLGDLQSTSSGIDPVVANIEMRGTIHIILTSRLQQFLFLTSSVLVAAKHLEVRVEKSKNIKSKIIPKFPKQKCQIQLRKPMKFIDKP